MLDKGDARLILAECKKHGLLRNQAAYVLATAQWETAHTMKPVREYGGEKYLRSKKYYPYVGMGYVQLTWKTNYERASRELGVDFVKNPKLLLEAKYAAPILVIGMKEGWFTGKKLADYITLQRSDFTGARRIVNGTDKATQIAALAKKYDDALKAEGYGATKPTPAPEPQQGGIWAAIINILAKLFKRS
jgi:predicted chitinase